MSKKKDLPSRQLKDYASGRDKDDPSVDAMRRVREVIRRNK